MSEDGTTDDSAPTSNSTSDANTSVPAGETISNAAKAAAEAEADKLRKEFLYLRAEFENFKKQAVKERSDLRKYGNERLIIDLLNVLDIFETALATPTNPENVELFRKGIDMTSAELKAVLGRHGVEEVPAQGQPFDPSAHEALSSEESDLPAGSITRVFKKPYKLHDRVIRPGQVIVSKAKN